MIHQSCACSCGHSTFAVKGAPLLRFICHCEICQAIYKQPFADVTVFLQMILACPKNIAFSLRNIVLRQLCVEAYVQNVRLL